MTQLLYPIGIQSFPNIREGGYIYVDKTSYIHRLVTTGKYYFLSRPRRFGKSLLMSTIEEFFKGQRDLFEGLAISDYDYDWAEYPVLHLDLSGFIVESRESLYIHLEDFFSRWEERFSIIPNRNVPAGLRFKQIILSAHEQTGRKVVILVDEYDKPLLETVGQQELQKHYRNVLRSLYSNLKSQDEHIQFALLTGVTKFGHLSIFSDLNNLNDISLDAEYSGICGITNEELHTYFNQGVKDFADSIGKTEDDVYTLLKENYDGYHFSPIGSKDVYNPFSVLNCFSKKYFSDFWFKTGTPSFLIRMIKEENLPLRQLNRYETSLSSLSDVTFELGDYISVLYQSGYLTIKSYDTEYEIATVGFPNKEVERGFFNQLMPIYTSVSKSQTSFEIVRFVKDIKTGNAEDFMIRLQSLFSDFQYDSFDLKHLEQHYQDVVYILVKLMGFHTYIEYKTASGRIDLVIKTSDYIYLFEFKMDKTATEAIDQIKNNGYLLPFNADNRKVIMIGANFSSSIRSIDSWIIE
ncbi:MAG: ATP-binding protein [Muribaculaceae bacterium]